MHYYFVNINQVINYKQHETVKRIKKQTIVTVRGTALKKQYYSLAPLNGFRKYLADYRGIFKKCHSQSQVNVSIDSSIPNQDITEMVKSVRYNATLRMLLLKFGIK